MPSSPPSSSSSPGSEDGLLKAEPAEVIVGTSSTAVGELKGDGLVRRISHMVNEAYRYERLSFYEVEGRLEMGDAGMRANRVLHLAHRGGVLVGCCSSTIQPPWTERGCGHWGLLVVAVEAQGTGVASVLVRAAESRLRAVGRTSCQIEYQYTQGDPFSERLYRWYEGTCGFVCSHGPPRTSGGRSAFRRCRKRLGGAATLGPGADRGSGGSGSSDGSGGSAAAPRHHGSWLGFGWLLPWPSARCCKRLCRRLLGVQHDASSG